MGKQNFFYRVFDLYYDGFRNMRLGRTLWAIILIKLFIMFAILEPDYVATEMIDRSK